MIFLRGVGEPTTKQCSLSQSSRQGASPDLPAPESCRWSRANVEAWRSTAYKRSMGLVNICFIYGYHVYCMCIYIYGLHGNILPLLYAWEIFRILKWIGTLVPYVWPYFVEMFPYIGLKFRPSVWSGRYLQSIGS